MWSHPGRRDRTSWDSAHVPPIVGRANRLFCLNTNAMEAMAGGGRITVTAQAAGRGVVVRVLDEGDGLSPGIGDAPFEKFVSTKAHDAKLSLPNRDDRKGAVAEVVFPTV